MNRQDKEHAVQFLKEQFTANQAAFVVDYKGLTVFQMQDLRGKLRSGGGTLKVAKARLLQRAVASFNDASSMRPYLKEQIGVVFASDEAPAIAKILNAFAKEHEALKIIMGRLDGSVFDKVGVTRVASLPSKDVQRAIVLAALQAPISGMVRTLNMIILKLLFALKQIEKSKK